MPAVAEEEEGVPILGILVRPRLDSLSLSASLFLPETSICSVGFAAEVNALLLSKLSQGTITSSRVYEVHLRIGGRGIGAGAGGGDGLELVNDCDGSNEELSVGRGSYPVPPLVLRAFGTVLCRCKEGVTRGRTESEENVADLDSSDVVDASVVWDWD